MLKIVAGHGSITGLVKVDGEVSGVEPKCGGVDLTDGQLESKNNNVE